MMPYLAKRYRDEIDAGREPSTQGELNYALTRVALRYLKTCGLSYATINDIMGAFASAAIEFYRRIAAPYEDEKIGSNGDVYGPLEDYR